MFDTLRALSLWDIPISAPFALALVATLGYLFGRRSRTSADALAARSRREIRRAQTAARELEKIAWIVRRNLARHHTSLSKFKERLSDLGNQEQDESWKCLCREAAEILTPTLRLAGQIATAYDEIREQSDHLTTLTEAGTDPLTGLGNRQCLEQALADQLALMNRYEQEFAVAVFGVDQFQDVREEQGHLHGDRELQQVARIIDQLVRETDVVARYGSEQFVAVLPRTDLEGASVLGERVRACAERQLPLTVSAGVTTVLDGDTPETILSRAEAALRQAQAAGRNCVFRHDGERIEPANEEEAALSGP